MIYVDVLDSTPEGDVVDKILAGKREKINIDDIAERMNNQNIRSSGYDATVPTKKCLSCNIDWGHCDIRDKFCRRCGKELVEVKS